MSSQIYNAYKTSPNAYKTSPSHDELRGLSILDAGEMAEHRVFYVAA